MSLSDYQLCKNCGYSVIDLSDQGFCENCERAYQLGYERGRERYL
jgi:hypothetical protein